PSKKRADRVKHGARLLLGLKMAAGNGPSFDLGCPSLPDRQRRFLPLKTPLLPQHQYRAIEGPPGGTVGEIVLVVGRRSGPVILHHRMPDFAPAKGRAIRGQRLVRQTAGILPSSATSSPGNGRDRCSKGVPANHRVERTATNDRRRARTPCLPSPTSRLTE